MNPMSRQMVMIYKMCNNFFFFFLSSLITSMIVQKAAWETSQRQKEPTNKDKLCHIILGWPLLSICHKEGNFGSKQFHWPRHPHRALPFQTVLSSQCLSLAIQDPLFPFSANFYLLKQIPVSVWSWDSHPLCQETCPSHAFIFEGMCLCRKPTLIRVTLTQIYSSMLILRGGMAWWKDFLSYRDTGRRSHFCPLLGFTTFAKVTYILWALISSFVEWQ